jgi:hypothetical protein
MEQVAAHWAVIGNRIVTGGVPAIIAGPHHGAWRAAWGMPG